MVTMGINMDDNMSTKTILVPVDGASNIKLETLRVPGREVPSD